MGRRNLQDANEETYNAISLYYSGVSHVELTDLQKKTLERWRDAHALLRKYPRPHIAAKMLQSKYPEISLIQARVDVQNAARLWNVYDKPDREFLESWFVDALLREISNPAAKEETRAKNLQTLGNWLKNMPPVTIDPKLMEKNNVNIIFNVDNKSINLTENELLKLKVSEREKLIKAIPNSLDEEQAAQILES